MISGKKVYLKEVEEEHLPILLKYRNNPNFRKYYREYRVLNSQNKLNWWKDKVCNDDSWQFFVVTPHQEPDKVIGSVGLTYIHPVYKSGEFSLTIGDEDYRGGGYGSDALRTVIMFGFDQLNLNRIWCEVYSNNKAVDVYKHIGFKEEGVLRQSVFKDGEYHDSHVMSMLKSEYKELEKQWKK